MRLSEIRKVEGQTRLALSLTINYFYINYDYTR